MSMFRNPFRRDAETRALQRETWPLSLFSGGPTVFAPTVTGPMSALEALRLVDVWSCVQVIVSAASTLPLIPYRRAGDGRERLTGGRLADLLQRPAPGLTQGGLIGHVVASLATRGNAYIGMYADDTGQVGQLQVISSERIIVQVIAGVPQYRLTLMDGRQVICGESDIIHVRLPVTLDGVTGLSPLAQCREALGLSRALAEQASAGAVNDSAPRGILTVPGGPLGDEIMENLRERWEQRHAGPLNTGRVAVVTGDVDFKPVGFNPRDYQFVDQRKLSTTEICRIFNVPPSLINAPSNDSLTYSTVEAEALRFVTFCLQPYLSAIEQAVSNSPLCTQNTYCEFLLDSLLRSDSKTRAETYALALGNPTTGQPGWMTRDEVRQRENLPAETQGQPQAQQVQLEAVA
jgi:HK97 family phage portal protein